MRLGILICCLPLTIFAQSAKVYWRCADNHLLAMEPKVIANGKSHNLYVNFSSEEIDSINYAKIGPRAMVELPGDIMPGSYFMLGGKGQWAMNCVGKLHPHKGRYHQNQLIFDVKRNAYGCPFIPKTCGTQE